MRITKLRIDSQMFYLAPDEDVDGLKQRIRDTARGPADYVVFTPVGFGEVSVLMTPHTPVRFEEQERTEEEVAEWEQHPPRADVTFDSYTDFDAA